MAAAPEVPTVEESSGLKGFELVSWYGVWGPKGLPAEITARLNNRDGRHHQTARRVTAAFHHRFEPVGSSRTVHEIHRVLDDLFVFRRISDAMYFVNSSGLEPTGSKPMVESRCDTSGCLMMAAISVLSRAVISAGRPFGPQTPYQETSSKPLEARRLLDGRHLGRRRHALEAGDRQRLDLAALGERQRGQHRIGQQLDGAAHQVVERRRGALVGDDQRVELGSRLRSSAARWLAEPGEV